MTDQNRTPCPNAPAETVNDLLARLYREIGISAVAAALEVTSTKKAPATDTGHHGQTLEGDELAA